MWFLTYLSCKIRGHKFLNGTYNSEPVQFCDRCGKMVLQTTSDLDGGMTKFETVKANLRAG